ncbi:MAG: hypothetical protein ACI9BW_004134 [Gammaproteobacteria bacterium]|jgi:hypothetical protein
MQRLQLCIESHVQVGVIAELFNRHYVSGQERILIYSLSVVCNRISNIQGIAVSRVASAGEDETRKYPAIGLAT